jgi:hypothetical protein
MQQEQRGFSWFPVPLASHEGSLVSLLGKQGPRAAASDLLGRCEVGAKQVRARLGAQLVTPMPIKGV